MKFTNFSNLKDAIKRIGIIDFEVELLIRLQHGDLEGNTEDTENIIVGKFGIYRLENSFLSKVLLHITSIDKRWIEQNKQASAALNQKKYDSRELIRALHKYHFTKCTTIDTMFSVGRKKRYHLARKIDGTFKYHVVDGGIPFYTRKNQKLNVCRYCLGVLEGLTGKSYSVDDFDMNDIFDTNVVKLNPSEHDWACNAVPNIYVKDWKMIADKQKWHSGWKCEKCKVNLASDQKYLHCHHADTDLGNNVIANLEVLCIKCHADQPNHQHIRSTSQYKQYIDKYHAN